MAGTLGNIYNKSPYPVKVIALNLKAYLNIKQRFNKEFKAYLKKFTCLWYAENHVIKDYQRERLKVLLNEVFLHSDWYGAQMKELGIEITDIENEPFQVLQKMPVLQKTDRKENVLQLSNKSRETTMVHYTSGTSGSPTVDYIDLESINISFAFWKRFHHVIGIENKCRQVRFSGRLIVKPTRKKPPFWVYNFFDKQLLMSTYHLTEKNLGSYIQKLNRFKPVLIDGYPSSIYIVSRFINQKKITLDFTPKAIAVTAETLYDYQREAIEKAFKCKVFNQYASNEGSPFITECMNGNLHLNIDSGVFEFYNNQGQIAKPGEMANLIVTSFINFKTPLIRYSIGDTVLLSEENDLCSCGCKMPFIRRILGREDDILWTKEKGYVGRMDTVYKGLRGIAKSQIIQDNTDKIVVNMIVEDGFDNQMEDTLVENLKDRLGQNIEIEINKLNIIPLGANGKFVAVKRNFKIPRFSE